MKVDLEPADEEARGQIPEPGVFAGLAQRAAQRLRPRIDCARSWRPDRSSRFRHRCSQRHRGEDHAGQYQQCMLPVDGPNEPGTKRNHQELAERTAGRGDAQRDAAPFRRECAADDAQNDAEAHAADAESDEQPGAEVQHQGRGRKRHQCQPSGIQQPGEGDHPAAALLVRPRAEERLGQPPNQIGQREREGIVASAPA